VATRSSSVDLPASLPYLGYVWVRPQRRDPLRTPQAREQLSQFRALFSGTRRQIALLGRYKAFHDVLQEIENPFNAIVPNQKRRLAYEVAHHRDGQYGVVEFSLPTTQARELERTIRLTEDILRHLVVRRDE